MENRQKLLILSLGAGSIIDKNNSDPGKSRQDKIKEIVETGNYPYINTIYRISIDEDVTESDKEAFVASPIIDYFRPDKVFIIGTVKSTWATFLARFHDKGIQNDTLINVLCELDEIQETGGISTAGEILDECQKRIEELLIQSIDRELFPELNIILTRYGINEVELEENYKRIKNTLSRELNKDTGYDAAFDITFSFRSLPIYNIVLLNYLKHVDNYDISVKHVFYGNVDAKYEMGGKAPLVDLASLTDIMDFTNGVTEFKKTGNSGILLDSVPKDSELYTCLLEFDRTLQLNDFDGIVESIRELSNYFRNKPQNGKIVRAHIEDVETIIQNTIRLSILDGRPLSDFAEIDSSYELQRDLRWFLARWFKEQNRYGQACIASMEALRSLVTPIYLKTKGLSINIEACNDEKCRKASIEAVDRANSFWGENTNPDWGKDSIELIQALSESINKTRDIRNMYAHILNSNSLKNEELSKMCTDDKIKLVDVFFETIEKLYAILDDEDKLDKFEKVYSKEGAATKRRNNKERVRLIVNDKDEIDKDNIKRVVNRNRKSNIYIIPQSFRTKLHKHNNDNWDESAVEYAYILRDYISKHFNEEISSEGFAVILDEKLSLFHRKVMALILNQSIEGVKFISMNEKTQDGFGTPKIGLCPDESIYDRLIVSKEYETIIQDRPELIYQIDSDKETETQLTDTHVESSACSQLKENSNGVGVGILVSKEIIKDEDLNDLESTVRAKEIIGITGTRLIMMPQDLREAIEVKDRKELSKIAESYAQIIQTEYKMKDSVLLFDHSVRIDQMEEFRKVFSKYGVKKFYCYLRSGWKGPFKMQTNS